MELNQILLQIKVYSETSEAKASAKKAMDRADEVAAELAKAAYVTPEKLHHPITI